MQMGETQALSARCIMLRAINAQGHQHLLLLQFPVQAQVINPAVFPDGVFLQAFSDKAALFCPKYLSNLDLLLCLF